MLHTYTLNSIVGYYWQDPGTLTRVYWYWMLCMLWMAWLCFQNHQILVIPIHVSGEYNVCLIQGIHEGSAVDRAPLVTVGMESPVKESQVVLTIHVFKVGIQHPKTFQNWFSKLEFSTVRSHTLANKSLNEYRESPSNWFRWEIHI